MDTDMDSSAPSGPSSSAPATMAASFFKPSSLKAPERERVQAQSPLKYSAAEKKRPRDSEGATAATADAAVGINANSNTNAANATTATASDFSIVPDADEYTRKLENDNRDLRHQISVLSAQMANFQASVSGQFGAVTAQLANMSQQLARVAANAANATTPAQTTKTYSSAGTPRTYTVPPPPPPKPVLKLSLGKKQHTASAPPPPLDNQPKTTYAGVAAIPATNTDGFQMVTKKKPAKKGPLRPLYNPNDQKVIIQVHPDTPPATTIQMTWQYLQMANRAVREYQKAPDYCFVRCHVTQKQNLVLQTSAKTKGTDYLTYLEYIKSRIEEEGNLKITSIEGEPRWSKFLLHGVPISATMDDVATSIQQSYPGVLQLAQTPRWLTTDLKRQTSGKGMSTVVLSVAGKHTLQSLGYQFLFICNSRCRLAKYLPFGPSSQCGNCCRFGHPTSMCQDKVPTCGVCGKQHATRYHPCPAPDCKGGGRCTHSPTHCVNCENNLHTSIHPQCPAREKARQQKLRLDTTTEYDTTVQLDPNVSTTNQVAMEP